MITDADGDQLIHGSQAFIKRLYDHFNYKKLANDEIPKKGRQPLDENPDVAFSYSIVEHDEYSYVAQQVPLPGGETKESQENNRKQLMQMKAGEDSSNVRNLMGEILAKCWTTQYL